MLHSLESLNPVNFFARAWSQGVLYLQHANDPLDEAVVATWLENPYWQYFCGKTTLQTKLSIDPLSLSSWRKRIGEIGVQTLLAVTIDAARAGGLIKNSSLNRFIVDTTVMPKAITHPTDNRLLDKGRQHLVKLAQRCSIALRQNYKREAPRLAAQIGRYAHARQCKLMSKAHKTLRSQVGRMHREVTRKLHQLPEQVQIKAREVLHRVRRILTHQPKDHNKLYALHAVRCGAVRCGAVRATISAYSSINSNRMA